MPTPNPDAMAFLLTRRSRPAKTLTLPVPTRDQLAPILTAGLRVPDHGKLEPWRLLVLERPALLRLADLVVSRGQDLGLEEEAVEKARQQYAQAHLVICVIHSPKSTAKIPAIEQILSSGAVCLSLLNAALASGWGANWLSGWASHDAEFCQKGLGLAADEFVAGMIHIGTETNAPPERPRPNTETVISWVKD